MTTELLRELDFTPLVDAEEREITGGFCGDLLSWVMGRAQAGQLWLTIMTNVNVPAVALLTGVSAVLICEGCAVDEEALAAAKQKGINLLVTGLPVYEAACSVFRLLS